MKKETKPRSGKRRRMGILMIHPEKIIDKDRLPADLPGWVNKQLEHFSPTTPRLILTGGCELYFPHILWLWKRGNLYVLPDNSLSDLAASLYHYTQIESANGNNPRMSEKTILVRLYQFYRELREFPDTQADYFIRQGIFYLLLYARHRKEKLRRIIKRFSGLLLLFLHLVLNKH